LKRGQRIPQAITQSTSKASQLGKKIQIKKHTQEIKKKTKCERGRLCQQARVVVQWLNKSQCSTKVKIKPYSQEVLNEIR